MVLQRWHKDTMHYHDPRCKSPNLQPHKDNIKSNTYIQFGALKEHFLPDYATRFQEAGYSVLLYDNRNWGSSTGTPRNEVDPALQARDYSDAFDYAASLPDVDPFKIVFWGTSMSGGVAICAAAIDHRICAVVVQGAFVSGEHVGAGTRATEPLLFGNRKMMKTEGKAMMLPITPENVEELRSGKCLAILQDEDVFPCIEEMNRRGVHYEKLVTANSSFNLLSFEPRAYIHRISPTPLLVVLAEKDMVIGTDRQLGMYELALEPKQLHIVRNVGHFGVYFGERFEENIGVQVKFLRSIF